ncbi:hypothetical protein CYMTET_48901 [Cymbomonas tetramitiformis]|uniref:tRNA N(3)-methylcytidine methyltransferase n=1 Tax=Cymbomonas tetramitiformis TaxID=36881 RepID=A0AAE0BSJ5_9CHLO|nr:hypothetical protein CYMTET_48901 [Cymbomonas tetramitiformis]
MGKGDTTAVEYHSHDFNFEWWKQQVISQGLCPSDVQPHPSVEEASCDDVEYCQADCVQETQQSAWEQFHQQHEKGVFFKERRYLLVEFPELSNKDDPYVVLEIGCGNGSSALPLLRANPKCKVYACDFSPKAVDATCAAASTLGDLSGRFIPFVCDVAATVPVLPDTRSSEETQQTTAPPPGSCGTLDILACGRLLLDSWLLSASTSPSRPLADHALLVFVASAVHPARTVTFLRHAAAAVRPGGCLLFRDYGLYDMTMLRFPAAQRLDERLYKRQDGTLTFFFTVEDLHRLCAELGLQLVECEYCCVELVNRKNKKPMRRVFVHARMRIPVEGISHKTL